ncbi:MAG: membrane dipeptidase [Spirochaetes bacterium]|uniref:Membrane dipeptidase n=1 Tax=Candidatus Ornithospirochaeta stercoripullorum TaxID=2840899 RepID=A0A9D9H1R6_9SPIO|nr:membrane dipeptidase [Candidatus Ornithospirochaeta stercoripullorum]
MIDLHSDTIYALWKDNSSQSVVHNSLHIDKEKLLKAESHGQCFALFTPMHDLVPERHKGKSPWQMLVELHDRFVREMKGAAIPVLHSAKELEEQTLHAILTTEEGGAIEGDISRLKTLKDWGVRIFGLTWNWENELGYPNSSDSAVMAKGLKEKGIEAVEECSRLGIIIDVSHLSDGGFRDVIRYSKLPVVATHSNARSVTAVSRNLTDEELCMLAESGGVAGLNLCPAFLHDEKASRPEEAVSRVCDMVRHVMHVYKTAGEDVLAIGTDFDGIEGNLEIASPDKFYILRDALLKAGMKPSVVDKMWEENAKRVFQSAEEEDV